MIPLATVVLLASFLSLQHVACQSIPHREMVVHIDLKGAPPRATYFKQLMSLISDLGGNGILVEWEDMFPFRGELESIKNGNAYSENDVIDILKHAKTLGLTVIPLVQTLGHLEWVLKTAKFAQYREDQNYPMVVCVGDEKAVDLILDSVNQVIDLHDRFDMPYIHIGADEAFQIGVCDEDQPVLAKFQNDTKKLVFDYMRRIATNITQRVPKTKVLTWFDEFKTAEPSLIKEFSLDTLLTPVVWKYTANLEKDLPEGMWKNLSLSFRSVWGGSAVKGADGANRIWNRMKPYVQNNKQWFLQSLKYSDLFADFHGIMLTGWQRYDHFASLCELWPVSIASLAINLHIAKNFIITESDASLILASLRCPASTKINDVIAGTDKCKFPGYPVRDAIREFLQIKSFHENSTWVHNREAGWLGPSHMRLNASNPFYVDAIGGVYQRAKSKLDANIEKLKKTMNDIYFSDVAIEFITDYVMPFYDDIDKRLQAVQAIDQKKNYPARPWFGNATTRK